MKLPKKEPKTTVRVYPDGKDQFKMVIMRPEQLATFRMEGTKWVTEDGMKHRTHRDAMRHIAVGLKDRDLLKAVPASVKIPQKAKELSFKTPQDALRFAVTQAGFTDFLLAALDQYTKPKARMTSDGDVERADQAV